jgi:signal transduction protein with GAF and PtsI domain
VKEGVVVAFVGIRLIPSDGHPVGTLSVVDRTPRRWSSHQVNSLRILSTLLVGEVESRNVEGSGVPESLVLSGNATSES